MAESFLPVDQLAQAIQQCREAQFRWAQLPVRARLKPVRAFHRALLNEVDAFCDAIREDIDKPAQQTIAGELLPLADLCKFLQQHAISLLKPGRIGQRPLWLVPQRDVVHRRPRGIVGIIGTWNYPYYLNGIQILEALTAGNGVVWKPSEVAPRAAAVLTQILRKAGYPKHLFQVMEPSREGGPALVEADINHLVFTGSASTGKVIARRLGERLISSSLELSGCDACFVMGDVDTQFVANALWFGATLNSGQTCLATRRAFIDRSVYSSLVEKLKALAARAEPMKLALDSQVEQAQRLIQDAVARGATQYPEVPQSSNSVQPTLLLDATAQMQFCQDACFAPVLALIPVDSMTEAVALDKACPYALGASIFCADLDEGERLATSLEAGAISINDVIAPTAHPMTPFGGHRQSGWGVTQGAEGLIEMTVPQVVSRKSGTFRPHYNFAAGKNIDQEEMMRGLLEMTQSPSLLRRWRGIWRVFRGMKKMKSDGQKENEEKPS